MVNNDDDDFLRLSQRMRIKEIAEQKSTSSRCGTICLLLVQNNEGKRLTGFDFNLWISFTVDLFCEQAGTIFLIKYLIVRKNWRKIQWIDREIQRRVFLWSRTQ